LAFHGAIEDANVPVPFVAENQSSWALVEGDEGDDMLMYDGLQLENAPRYKNLDDPALATALDPEVPEVGREATPDLPEPQVDGHPQVDADVVEAQAALSAEADELVSDGRTSPKGWRIDNFRGRLVHVPPWSLRPPTMEPEEWLMVSAKYKAECREKWKANDPTTFNRQEKRRKKWRELKDAGKVVQALSAARHVVTDAGREATPDLAVHNLGNQHQPLSRVDSGVDCRKMFEQVKHKVRSFKGNLSVHTVLLELCCEEKSRLSAEAPEGTLAIHASKACDLTNYKTIRFAHDVIQFRAEQKVQVKVWVSIPCTAGCPLKHLNNAKGIPTGDPILTNKASRGVVSSRLSLVTRGSR
jgi:hypothetical protein